MTDISIIIVNYNTRELLRDCLESVYLSASGLSFEILVVDNASTDQSVAMVREAFPQVRVIENTTNRGFGAANNQAMRAMTGKYALLLNSDTVVSRAAIGELMAFMEDCPEAGMACGQLLNRDGSKQNSIASFPTLLSLITNTTLLEYLFPRKYPSKRYYHSEAIEVDSGVGACLIVRKAAIDAVGMFDERYFFFFEETDWARQMKQAGWKIYFVPSARIFHLQGSSIGGKFPSRVEFYRSRYQYLRKWDGPVRVAVSVTIIVVRLLMNWILSFASCVATLGLSKALRSKVVLYSNLIGWHLIGCPNLRKS